MFYKINFIFSFISIALFFISWIFNGIFELQLINDIYSFSQLCVISFYFIIFLIRIFYRDKNNAKVNNFVFDIFIIIFILIDKIFCMLPSDIKSLNIEYFFIAIRIFFMHKYPPANVRLMRYPERSVIISYAATIFYGALLLSLPFSWQPNVCLSFIDAFFISTSASCITGLVSVDLSTTFSLAGQVIICTLVQLGGIGIMIFSVIIAFTFNKH